jgi:hypothetical protein
MQATSYFALTVSLDGQAVPKPSYNITIKNNLLVGTNGIANFRTGTVRRLHPPFYLIDVC